MDPSPNLLPAGSGGGPRCFAREGDKAIPNDRRGLSPPGCTMPSSPSRSAWLPVCRPAGNRQILPAAGLEIRSDRLWRAIRGGLAGLTKGLFPRQAMPRTARRHYALRARPADGTMLAQPPTRFALWLKNRAKVLLFASVFCATAKASSKS